MLGKRRQVATVNRCLPSVLIPILLSAAICEALRQVNLPFELCSQVLQDYQDLTVKHSDVLMKFPDELCEGMDLVYQVCRAVVVVSSPVPGYLGSAYSDATAVFGNELAKPNIADDDLDEADNRAATERLDNLDSIKTAALRNKTWAAKISAFWTLGMGDKAIEVDFNATLASLTSEPSASTVAKSLIKVKKFMGIVRVGGCQPLLDALHTWLAKVATSASFSWN
jgi:hypothetical protein